MLLIVSSVLRMPQLLGEAEAPLAAFQAQSIHTTELNSRLSFYYFFFSFYLNWDGNHQGYPRNAMYSQAAVCPE